VEAIQLTDDPSAEPYSVLGNFYNYERSRLGSGSWRNIKTFKLKILTINDENKTQITL
jgi:hypothetical protein